MPAANVIERIKPHARAMKYARAYRRAVRIAAGPARPLDKRLDPSPVFVVACGRSGTTILGRLLAEHPELCYLFEPYHDWAAIDPRTDAIQLYTSGDAHCILRAEDATDMIARRFRRIFHHHWQARGGRVIVEKTPLNAMRIGYLRELAPGARFIHIVRDGVDVVRSIQRLASTNTYRIAGKPLLNQWWGVDDSKWRFLQRDGIESGYFPKEAVKIDRGDHRGRGAYEWLVSLLEIDQWRTNLGDDLLEFRYDDLAEDPASTLERLCRFIGVDSVEEWVQKCERKMDSPRRNDGDTIFLPPRMNEAFNRLQERFGFPGRSESLSDLA